MKVFFYLYSFLIYVLTPLFLFRLKWKSRTNKAYGQRIKERFGFYESGLPEGPHDVWIHAVSFGEVEVANELIRHWCKQGKSVLVTTTTPTGSARVKALFSKKVTHVYVPFEWPFAIRRFLRRFNPKLLVIIETELWPNLITITAQHALPIVITNARLSERSMRGYAYISSVINHVLKRVDCVIAQSEEDGKRFVALGLGEEKLIIGGNLKFDSKVAALNYDELSNLRQGLFGSRDIMIAASTHPGEEALLLECFKQLKRVKKNLVLIIAPRHPERVLAIEQLIDSYGFKHEKRTSQSALSKNDDVFILDTLGELQLFYHLCDIAFVGGSLVAHGGHNVLEAIRAKVPVVVGQYTHNFAFITEQLLKVKGLVQVHDVSQLTEAVVTLFESTVKKNELIDAAHDFLMQHKGALKKNISIVDAL